MMYLQHRKPADGMLIGSSSRNIVGDGPTSPKYSDKLSPAINNYLSEASRQEVRVRYCPFHMLLINLELSMFASRSS